YYWCYKNNIPVFCPAITDGSIGDMIYFHSFVATKSIALNDNGDLREAPVGGVCMKTPHRASGKKPPASTAVQLLGHEWIGDHLGAFLFYPRRGQLEIAERRYKATR
ncbi:hypothetical protein FOZ63_022029, partial [Perkinsus olseni]